jgi:cyclopropane-fatty-acyl-phospholipid synthase
MAGDWDTPDLARFLEFAAYNIKALSGRRIVPEPLQPLQRAVHSLRPNTLKGARKNIQYHYDLGNDFYSLWLDDTMTYSCAAFEDDVEDLCDAQVRKWDRLLELLDLKRGQHLLEIGCGWGGFAMHAAREAGCRVTGISLSKEQTAWARERVADEGMEDLVDFRIQDYREMDERFDAVASIEMFEAVGERFWPAFFQTVRRTLKPGQRAAMQVITVADERFERYRRNTDFIQKYIFPGGMLPSPTAFRQAAGAEGLQVGQPDFFGQSYAATLGYWLQRFDEVLPRVRELGFDERFERMWRYYLASCRAGFLVGTIDVMRVTLDEPS